ncbi:uncharacterized protein DSM5745_02513 [Aspergillus mulundensis]|uniref:Uncharacterized protein n=1 Tax=Aspergillus mulundensis TaxID=1810919 RepID=A0A3D8SY89_9EURO|nr:hypothetical protein DSM5745_02513 [Aspergillus mulundensis]RDW90738.1 hypothetical protein DSM5745_02513 [Aspergillus mulundensis]
MSSPATLSAKRSFGSLRSTMSALSKFKKRLAAIKEEWGPLMAAKESWDDEYNFPAGRRAGQRLSWYQRAW